MTTIERETLVPLCPRHHDEMKSSEVLRLDPASNEPKMTPSYRCAEVSCHWTYSLSGGYDVYREGEPREGKESIYDLCPTHHQPFYISKYDSQGKIETWRCPEAGCESVKKSPMQR